MGVSPPNPCPGSLTPDPGNLKLPVSFVLMRQVLLFRYVRTAMNDYLKFNQDRWNRVSRNQGNPYTIPISHETLMLAKEQPLAVALTGGRMVPPAWFKRAPGNKILGLACGGGQQGPIFAVKGYDTTIMDYSEEQLAHDRMVADRENLVIQTVQADMTKPFPFGDGAFDIIFCPVSNVFIDSLDNLWRECSRVLKTSGLLMAGYMNPWIYMYDADIVWDCPEEAPLLTYSLPFDSRKLEQEGKIAISPEYGYEFSHTLEEQIRGQLKNGFAMIDFYESRDERNRLSAFGPTYIANLCIKI